MEMTLAQLKDCLLYTSCYAPSEIAALIGLKEAVKGNKVISYLSGGEET